MAENGKKLSEIYHERVEALKGTGVTNADAIRHVAADMGKTERTVRAGIHQYKSRNHGSSAVVPRRGRPKGHLSVEDALANARSILEQALSGIDGDIATAKAELDAAQARYDDLVATAKERRADLEKRIKALR